MSSQYALFRFSHFTDHNEGAGNRTKVSQVGILTNIKKYPFLTQRNHRLLESLSSSIMHDLLGLSSFFGG